MKKKIICYVFMVVLAIVNLILFFCQPGFSPFEEMKSSGGHDFRPLAILFVRICWLFYLPLVVVGTYAMIKTLYDVLTGVEVRKAKRVIAYCTLFSLFLVTIGTFSERHILELAYSKWRAFEEKWERSETLLLHSYGGEFYNGMVIWRNDTIIDRDRGTLIIDAENNSCYWTHAPELKYDLILDQRHKFEESPKNMTYAPHGYNNRIQYIIKSVNNKSLDQYYCDEKAYCGKCGNDSLLCFVVNDDERDSMGCVWFQIDDSVALFSETSLLKAADNDTVYDYEIVSFVKKENGMPLLKISYYCYEEDSMGVKRERREFTDYYDIEKKKFVLCVKTTECVNPELSLFDANYKLVKLYDYYSDIGMKDGYPIIDYIKEFDSDTLEVGRYEMENGVYVKKVSRAGD
ncbi:MAG: hypothetical protein J6R41_08770 [Paludibacteraceae bacterium]|nr:hypothetical protein [Paludibacteraceae bacterium]